MSNIVFQPLKTLQGCYIYDRSVDTIFAVSESEYQELKQLQNKEQACASPIVQQYQQRGLLRENNVSIIRHQATDALPHYCSNCVSSIILQVTQQCNLRCSYCLPATIVNSPGIFSFVHAGCSSNFFKVKPLCMIALIISLIVYFL